MTEALGADDLITRALGDNSRVQTNDSRQRRMALRNLKRATKKVWNHRNWHFRYKDGSHTATDGQFTIDDFVSFGPSGGLFVPGQTRPLTWLNLRDYKRVVNTVGQTGTPSRYTELGVTGSETVIGLYPLYDGDINSTYMFSCPEITDANPGGLDGFPIEWRDTVLYEWLIYYQMKDSANIQSVNEQLRIANDALNQMVQECRGGRSSEHNLVPYPARLRGR